MTRFNADGSPDSTFGSGGKVALQLGSGPVPSSGATAVALQPDDGKIVVAGTASDSHGTPELLVARLSGVDGSLDNSFDGNGRLAVQLGQGGQSSGLNAVAIQADRKILVAGQAEDSDGNSRFLVARLKQADGSFDSSFGSAGKVLTQLGTASGTAEQASALALQADGKIVVGGQAADSNHHVRFLVARLNAAGGGFDSSFGSGGKVMTQLGLGSQPLSAVAALAIQSDGKILAGGDASPATGNPAFMVERLGTNGTPDAAFGSGGKVVSQLGHGFGAFSAVASLALQPDGNVLAGGVATDADGDSALLLARLTGVDGSLDSSFGSGGWLIDQAGGGSIPSSQTSGIALQPDGRILAGGVANASDGNTRLLITRFFHDVAPSPVFALPSGPLSGNPLSFDGSASSDPDGTIAAYHWDFGDGSSAAGARSTHTYQGPGNYTVRLTVTDDKGLAATLSQSLVVAPGGPLTPSVRASVSRLGISPPEFAAANRGGSIARTTGATVQLPRQPGRAHHLQGPQGRAGRVQRRPLPGARARAPRAALRALRPGRPLHPQGQGGPQQLPLHGPDQPAQAQPRPLPHARRAECRRPPRRRGRDEVHDRSLAPRRASGDGVLGDRDGRGGRRGDGGHRRRVLGGGLGGGAGASAHGDGAADLLRESLPRDGVSV